jgi:hypothetical protein
MAIVQLLQATDMLNLPAFGGTTSSDPGTTHFNIFDVTNENSFASVEASILSTTLPMT